MKSRSLSLALLLMIAVITAILPSARAEAATCSTPVPGVAHRGGNERFVENTRNAFRASPSRVWETDVRFTADNLPVIMHDATVDRTTDGTGAVDSLTLAQVTALRTSDDQPVPTLRDVINDADVDGARVFIELKTLPTTEQWPNLLSALSSRPIASRLTITSFSGPTLVAMREHNSQYATGLIVGSGDQTVASVTQYGTKTLIKFHDAITSSRLNVWSRGGLNVFAWTVDTTSEWKRMNTYRQLRGLMTDSPAGYGKWLASRVC